MLEIDKIKQIVAGVAAILTFVAYIPYYRDIIHGKTHPHIYSWSLWGILGVLLVALQIHGGAGPATWVTLAATLMCFGIVILSIKDGKKDITTSDTVIALLSLLAIVAWLIAKQPILSMVLVILADTLAFIPTIRKSYERPYSETLSLYVTNTFRFILALLAVNNYTFLSVSWIVAWVIFNGSFASMLIVRRAQIKSSL